MNFGRKFMYLWAKARSGSHIFNLKTSVLGYKIHEPMYHDINFFITILIYSIYKSTHKSNYNLKEIEVYVPFKNEF